MEKTEKTVEELAESYADSIDRRGCAFWQGMYKGYIAGHDKVRNQTIQDCIDALKTEGFSPDDYNGEIAIRTLESLKTIS